MILIDTIRYGATTTIYLMKTFATPVTWFLTALANCMSVHLGIVLTLRVYKLLLLSYKPLLPAAVAVAMIATIAAVAAAAVAMMATIAAVAAAAVAAMAMATKAVAAAAQLPMPQANAIVK